MEATRSRSASSLGAFDMLKGLGLVMVIFAHTLELYQIDTSGGASLSTLIIFIYREALMSSLYIISGFGFRVRPLGKCLQQQRKAMLLPYLYTALATGGLHLLLHHHFFRDWHSAEVESVRVLGGFALGLPHTAEYFGVKIFSCGPMWYLLTLVAGWILLDILFNLVPERWMPSAVLGVMLLGWVACTLWELPYCLAQGMTVVPYLYIGYLAKRKKLLDSPLPVRFWVAFFVSAVPIAAGALLRQFTDSMSMGHWTLGPASILLNGVMGFGSVYLFTKINRFANPLTSLLENIGRSSLVVFCLHTVELQAVPWYLLASRFADQPLKGAALQFGLRSAFIAVFFFIVKALGRVQRSLRRRLKPQKQRSLSAGQ